MAKTATLSSKSQITVPAWARKQLHLQAGSRVAVRVEGEKLVLTRVDTDIESLRGSLRNAYGDAESYVRKLREEWKR